MAKYFWNVTGLPHFFLIVLPVSSPTYSSEPTGVVPDENTLCKQYELPQANKVWRTLGRTRILDNGAFCNVIGAGDRLCDLYSVHR